MHHRSPAGLKDPPCWWKGSVRLERSRLEQCACYGFTSGQLVGRNVLVGAFGSWGQGKVIIKAEESKCLVLGATDAFEKDKRKAEGDESPL